MKTILVLALIALVVQGLLAGPIGDGALDESARGTKSEKAAPVEPLPKKNVTGAPNLEDRKRMEAANHEPKDEENTLGTFQGDMKLTFDQLEEVKAAIDDQKTGRKKRKATSYHSDRWPNNIVPYVITKSSETDKSVIREAMNHWEDHTCLQFVPLNESDSTQFNHNSYLSFFKGNGCWSFVGRAIGSGQEISIGNGCASVGTIAHEIGHAIGFHHEQSRPDRDDYITVHYDNIEPGLGGNFAKYSWNEVATHDVPYDVGSLMHYGSRVFSKNGLPTITTLDPRDMHRLGNRQELSPFDIKLANLYLECDVDPARCPSDMQCENNGTLDPNCVCVCPSGFSGDRCEIVDKTKECGVMLTDRKGEIMLPNYPDNYDNDVLCVYRIVGAPETTIQLNFHNMDIEYQYFCEYDAVEVRTEDVGLPGQKFCGSDLPPVQTSTGNEMLVVFTSDYSNVGQGFKASYIVRDRLEVLGTCGGDFDGSSGVMASPNYPDNYDNSLDCVYHIEVEAGHRVELTILDFALEDEPRCGWDVLEVYLGNGIKIPMKLCGNSFPGGSLVSTDNQMALRLKTDKTSTAGGFKASYRAIHF